MSDEDRWNDRGRRAPRERWADRDDLRRDDRDARGYGQGQRRFAEFRDYRDYGPERGDRGYAPPRPDPGDDYRRDDHIDRQDRFEDEGRYARRNSEPYGFDDSRPEPVPPRDAYQNYFGGPGTAHGRGRGWMDQARDQLAAWFGDHDAGRRLGQDRAEGEHRGRGPSGYRRPDEKIAEDVHDRLTDDSWLDASNIEVAVVSGEVTLTGIVHDKNDKRRAESLADRVSGVIMVQNLLRVRSPHGRLHPAGSEQADDAPGNGGPAAAASARKETL